MDDASVATACGKNVAAVKVDNRGARPATVNNSRRTVGQTPNTRPRAMLMNRYTAEKHDSAGRLARHAQVHLPTSDDSPRPVQKPVSSKCHVSRISARIFAALKPKWCVVPSNSRPTTSTPVQHGRTTLLVLTGKPCASMAAMYSS